MDVLVTWSGGVSQDIARFLREWLPEILPGIKPWVSSEDIAKGKRWQDELTAQLAKSRTSITVVTPENVRSPWIYYEVGFIAAKLNDAAVCPYLIGVNNKEVRDTPLGQFQGTLATKEDSWRLIRSINERLEASHNEHLLQANFNINWPKLKRHLDKVLESTSPIIRAVEEVVPSVEQTLTEDARTLLAEASQDANGRITHTRTMTNTHLGTHGRNYTESASARDVARWKGALDELLENDLIEQVGSKGEAFKVTREGYRVADLVLSRS